MLDRIGAYRRANSLLRVRETEQVLHVSAQASSSPRRISLQQRPYSRAGCWLLCLMLVPLALFIEKSWCIC